MMTRKRKHREACAATADAPAVAGKRLKTRQQRGAVGDDPSSGGNMAFGNGVGAGAGAVGGDVGRACAVLETGGPIVLLLVRSVMALDVGVVISVLKLSFVPIVSLLVLMALAFFLAVLTELELSYVAIVLLVVQSVVVPLIVRMTLAKLVLSFVTVLQ